MMVPGASAERAKVGAWLGAIIVLALSTQMSGYLTTPKKIGRMQEKSKQRKVNQVCIFSRSYYNCVWWPIRYVYFQGV